MVFSFCFFLKSADVGQILDGFSEIHLLKVKFTGCYDFSKHLTDNVDSHKNSKIQVTQIIKIFQKHARTYLHLVQRHNYSNKIPHLALNLSSLPLAIAIFLQTEFFNPPLSPSKAWDSIRVSFRLNLNGNFV